MVGHKWMRHELVCVWGGGMSACERQSKVIETSPFVRSAGVGGVFGAVVPKVNHHTGSHNLRAENDLDRVVGEWTREAVHCCMCPGS